MIIDLLILVGAIAALWFGVSIVAISAWIALVEWKRQ